MPNRIGMRDRSAPTALLPPRSTAGQLTLDQHIGVRIPGGQPILFKHFHAFALRVTLALVRRWCGLVRSCFRIEPIDPCDVGSGDEMSVGVYGDLNRAVAHLVFHVSQGSAVLDQQTSEGVT